MSDLCPCGSGRDYEGCCGRFHRGSLAPTAEAMMRSRYSAYALRLADYLLTTWHASTRPQQLSFGSGEPRWCGLEIRDAQGGGEQEERGEVEFVARWYGAEGKGGTLHERSRFMHEAGRWYYLDGQLYPTPASKIGRNDPCPCGSGRKFKQCCAGKIG